MVYVHTTCILVWPSSISCATPRGCVPLLACHSMHGSGCYRRRRYTLVARTFKPRSRSYLLPDCLPSLALRKRRRSDHIVEMFYVKKLEHEIVLEPIHFGPKLKQTIIRLLKDEVEGLALATYGYVVNVIEVPEDEIRSVSCPVNNYHRACTQTTLCALELC